MKCETCHHQPGRSPRLDKALKCLSGDCILFHSLRLCWFGSVWQLTDGKAKHLAASYFSRLIPKTDKWHEKGAENISRLEDGSILFCDAESIFNWRFEVDGCWFCVKPQTTRWEWSNWLSSSSYHRITRFTRETQSWVCSVQLTTRLHNPIQDQIRQLNSAVKCFYIF